MGTSCCSSVPKIFLSSGLVGGSRWVALGSTLTCFLSGVHCVNRAPLMSWPGGEAWWRVVLTMMRTSPWLRRTSSHLSTWASPKAVPA